MKKLIGIILAAAMAFSLAACSSSGGSDQAVPETEAPVETTELKIPCESLAPYVK